MAKAKRTKSKTISASIPQSVYELAREIVRSERRKQSAVVADALRLYATLTPAARRVMEELAEQYRPTASPELRAELSRALLRARWETLAEETARQLPADLGRLSDEELAAVVDDESATVRRSR